MSCTITPLNATKRFPGAGRNYLIRYINFST
nr:MAG TPA: hypothetical protein [Caudoviricetes sp.]